MSNRQTSFAGGELAPELHGRVDLPRYGTGLRRCRNFVPTVTGAAMSRGGTDFAGAVKNAAAGKVRLIPFVYSSGLSDQSYVLEFGNQYIRVWFDGAQVLNGGVPYEVPGTIPYLTADLPLIHAAQEGAVVTLTCAGYPPAELTWDGTNWAYAVDSFDRETSVLATFQFQGNNGAPWLPDSAHAAKDWDWVATVLLQDERGVVTEQLASSPANKSLNVPPVYNSAVTYGQGAWVNNGSGTYYQSLKDNNTGNALTDTSSWASGTLPSPFPVVVYSDRPVVLSIALPSIDAGTRLVGYRIYRGRQGVYGLVGDVLRTSAAAFTWTDTGDLPDFTVQPPLGTNPFKVYDSSGTLIRTEYPACVTYFEGRRVFARTDQRPGWLTGSAVNDYSNFDQYPEPVADSAVDFTLATNRLEEIRSLVGNTELLVALTNSSAWAIGGAAGAPLSFDSVDAKVQSPIGASWLAPVVLDRVVLYVRALGSGVRSLTYGVQQELYRMGFQAEDISLVSQHLFLGHTIVDWAYSAHPWSVVWAVRDDGVLLSLTYSRQEQVFAWAWHDTDGAVESVCSVPENGEDAVYLVVRRTVNGATVRYVERMHSRVLPLDAAGNVDVTQAFALDCALSYSGAPITTVTGLSHLEGESVYAVADGMVCGPLTVTGGSITLPLTAGASVIHVGLLFTPELETLDPAMADRMKQKTITAIAVDVYQSRGLMFGQDSDHLEAWRERKTSDGYGVPPYKTRPVRVPVQGKWGAGARVFLRQAQPLPITVTGLTAEVDGGA